MTEIEVHPTSRHYSIVVGRGLLSSLGKYLKRAGLSGKVMIVTDRNVGKIYLSPVLAVLKKAGFQVFHAPPLPANESAKTEKWLFRLYGELIRAALERSSILVALGGGVVGDLTGFAASTYLRGVAWIVLPTTLLAQVDSAIGGKTAINLTQGKNLVGSFHPPRLVLDDLDFLKTLPAREFSASLAEVIKYAVIRDRALFSYLERNMGRVLRRDLAVLERVVACCARIKAGIADRDEREETGLRSILNYGHTFAHGFEAASGDWKSALPHGEAVAVGMVAAGEMACRLGLFAKGAQKRQVALIQRAGLPTVLEQGGRVRSILEAMGQDKKRSEGRLRFVLPTRLGSVRLVDGIPLSLVRNVIGELFRRSYGRGS